MCAVIFVQFCEPCLVRNANENSTGNPLEKNKFFCEIARIKHELMFQPMINFNDMKEKQVRNPRTFPFPKP